MRRARHALEQPQRAPTRGAAGLAHIMAQVIVWQGGYEWLTPSTTLRHTLHHHPLMYIHNRGVGVLKEPPLPPLGRGIKGVLPVFFESEYGPKPFDKNFHRMIMY